MPQQRKRKTAEEILGIAPRRKSAEEILGISAPAPQPTPQGTPQGVLESFQTGLSGKLLSNVVETAADFYNAPDETLERVGRAGLEFLSAFDPAGNAYEPTVQGQAARVAELNRRADERLPEFVKSAKIGQQIEEARPRTTGGKVAGAVGSVLGEIAFPTAPESIVSNVVTLPFGGAAAKTVGTAVKAGARAVPPILRRVRAGRNVGAAVEKAPATGVASQIRRTGAVADLAPEQAGVSARPAVAPLEAPQTLPTRPNYADEGPPMLELAEPEPFGVTEGVARTRTPGATGPRFDEAVEFELGRKSAQVTKEERTPVLETISALRKAGLLTGVKTHIKNITGSGGFQLGEEVSRIPGAIIDSLVSRVTKQRTLTGPSLGSVGRSAYEAATKGIDEAKSAIRTGQTKFDIEGLQEIASGSKVVDTYVNGVFRTLKAEDAVFRTYAFRRSLEDRARAMALTEVRQGKITRGQIGERTREILKAPPEDLAAGAAFDAEVATFNNSFADVAKTRPTVGTSISRAFEQLPKGAQFIADLVVPFKKTPTNVIARMLEYSPLGLAKNAVQAGKLANGILKKSFTPDQQRQFAQTFGRASLGSGLMALGYIGYRDGWLTGLQEDDTSRRTRDTAIGRIPGAILVGDTWHQLSGFAPLGNLLAIGASLARETEQEQEGFIEPIAEIGAQAVGEQPFLVGTQQVASSLRSPGTTAERLLGGVAGSFVPTAIADVAQLIDPQQREATTIGSRVASRVPGLRQTLPVAQDALGRPREDRATAFFDPTRTTTDQAQQNPLFAELVRLDVGVSGFDRDKDETGAKAQAFGQLYIPFGQRLVSSPEYRRASDELRKEAVKRLNSRAKLLVEENRQATAAGTLSPAALISAAQDTLRKQASKKNAAR